jgi:hypothetical protein
MNKIIVGDKSVVEAYKAGDIFVDDEGNYYMLATLFLHHIHNTKFYYTAICLADGICWSEPKSLQGAVEGLTFLKRDANIHIS